MLQILTELCQELRNWFDRSRQYGTYTIEDGSITLPFLVSGQYYRIVGSIFNDGVHKYDDETDALTDETFTGSVWAMAIPPAVLKLAADIKAWQEKYGGADSAAMSPFIAESFAGYSYSKSAETSTGGGWKSAFAASLNKWRKL